MEARTTLRPITPAEHLNRYQVASCVVDDALREFIRRPEHRLQLYKLINRLPLTPFRPILREMYLTEMSYRWPDEQPDVVTWPAELVPSPESFYEGLYNCAALLSSAGDPEDIALIWKADHRDMDIGSIEPWYLVGAGLEVAREYLLRQPDPEAKDILKYIAEHAQHLTAEKRREWQDMIHDWIDRQTSLPTSPHKKLAFSWPQSGRHVLAAFDDDNVVVYQAYRSAIAQYAVEHQRFGGEFSYSRMSWIKPNFLWMMYRSGWGQKEGQERILAVRLKRTFFDSLLEQAVASSYDPTRFESQQAWQDAVVSSDVRLQWDPDHDPEGRPLERRAVQLGLRGEALRRYGHELISIEDITDYVAEARERVGHPMHDLWIPFERVYSPTERAAKNIGLDAP